MEIRSQLKDIKTIPEKHEKWKTFTMEGSSDNDYKIAIVSATPKYLVKSY